MFGAELKGGRHKCRRAEMGGRRRREKRKQKEQENRRRKRGTARHAVKMQHSKTQHCATSANRPATA